MFSHSLTFINRDSTRHYLLLLLVCLLAYWPLTFGVFSVKNDAIHYFLPYRFNISEAIRHGESPFWSPYIYLGYPVQGDMQSGAWNPVVWLFSLIGRYDLTLFHAENLLYIFLGGLGMYRLVYSFVHHRSTAFLIGCSYMLSGYMLGGQLINWLAAGAFLPFTILFYQQFLLSPSLQNAIKTGLVLFLFFTSSYPSFFIITGYIMLAMLIIRIYDLRKSKQPFKPGSFILQHFLLLLIFAGLSLPAIISYIDLLPYYQRGAGTSYLESASNAWELRHGISLLFPSTIRANDMTSVTDLTCRNIYIGLLPILAIFIAPPERNRRNMILLTGSFLALLFSLGDATPFRKICYDVVPLMNVFRHPSQARLFMIIGLLLLVAPSLSKTLTGELTSMHSRKFQFSMLTVAILFSIIGLVSFMNSSVASLLAGGIGNLKTLLYAITFRDALFIDACIQALTVLALIITLKKRRRLWTMISVANLVIMAQLVLSASFVSSVPPKKIYAVIHASPQGFPVIDADKTLFENSRGAEDNWSVSGLSVFYSKKFGLTPITNSPAFLSQMDSVVQDSVLYQFVGNHPVVYISNRDSALGDERSTRVALRSERKTDSAMLTKITSNSFSIKSTSYDSSDVVLAQNYHHSWKVFIDDRPGTISVANGCMMKTRIPAGVHYVTFVFRPVTTIRAMWIQALILSVLAVYTGFYFFTRKKKHDKA